jgi:hypothetical protein
MREKMKFSDFRFAPREKKEKAFFFFIYDENRKEEKDNKQGKNKRPAAIFSGCCCSNPAGRVTTRPTRDRFEPQDHQATTEAGCFDLSRHTLAAAAGGGGGHLIFLFFLHFVLVVT